MKIMQEEIFGPVCAISKFKDEEEVIRLGNETTYGLAAAIHTKDLNTSLRVCHALKAGTVWVNCKFQESKEATRRTGTNVLPFSQATTCSHTNCKLP
jgi:aldehyde dehydrogenase (NAD+)